MKPALYDLFDVMAKARHRPEMPRGDKLAELTALARRFWFLVTQHSDGTITITGPTITEPTTMASETATIRLLNETCSALLAEDKSNLIYVLEHPMQAPFSDNRAFVQTRVTAFRRAHRGYEVTFNTLTQQQKQGDSNVRT